METLQKSYTQSATDLDVFNRAFEISLLIHQATLNFPKFEQYSLGDQLRRATRSVCANIAEGFAKQKDSKAEFGRFLSMAIGSCAEINVWLLYCERLSYLESQLCRQWQNEYDIILRMLRKLKQAL